MILAINRSKTLEAINFFGVDIWNCYELSWLDNLGKPNVGILSFIIPCNSTNLTESKSLKLYLNSFNNKILSKDALLDIIKRDIETAVEDYIKIEFIDLENITPIKSFSGRCLDNLEVHCDSYQVSASLLLSCDSIIAKESLYTNLFRSNCPVTNQPDWASVEIKYEGPKIDESCLLRYLVSYREHKGFHENCIEKIFNDILRMCKPNELTVYGRFTRRGGIDINPIRSTCEIINIENTRLIRQ